MKTRIEFLSLSIFHKIHLQETRPLVRSCLTKREFLIGSFGKSSVFWCHTEKLENAPFAVILETISNNESALFV